MKSERDYENCILSFGEILDLSVRLGGGKLSIH